MQVYMLPILQKEIKRRDLDLGVMPLYTRFLWLYVWVIILKKLVV